jgi:flavorubredoxin
MFTYLPQRKMLFSQDAFGMHLASSKRFDDEHDWSLLESESSKYFANILLPYTGFIEKLLAKVKSAGLEFEMVMPDHGPIWRTNIQRVFDLYAAWSKQRPGRKAVIAFDSMWGSTQKMAQVIADEITSHGAGVKVMPLSSNHRSDVATEILDAGALVVGSPTINNNIFPTVADVLVYLKGLKRKHLVGASFGSYGWGGEAVKQLNGLLTDMGIELVGDGVKVKYVPDEEALGRCRELGSAVAKRILANSSAE